jgi:hypothetical protein
MDTEMRRKFHLLISAAGNEESSFMSGYTSGTSELISGTSELMPLSGR